MTGGYYCTECGADHFNLPVGRVTCEVCGHLGLRCYDGPLPTRLTCPDHPEWSGWDDGGVNDDLGAHRRLEHRR